MGKRGWDTGKEMADSASGGGKFLSLKDDGDKATIVFIGEPFARLVFWDQEAQTYHDADSDEGKAFGDNHPDKKPSFRASINCLVLASGNGDKIAPDERVAIFEGGVNWFNDLVKCKTKYGLGVWSFELERSGKKGDTKTTYSILPDKKIVDVPGLAEKIVAAVEYNLEDPNSDDAQSPAASAAGGSSNGVITDEDSKTLITGLKALDRSELDAFLTEFGVKRIKELPSSKLADAAKWVADRSKPAATADEPEVDPFA